MLKPTPASAFTRLLRRYPLTAFFLLAYALTWPYMIGLDEAVVCMVYSQV